MCRSRPCPRFRLAAIVLAVLAVLCTACQAPGPAPAPAATPAPAPRTVDIVGDSLTVTSAMSVGWRAPLPKCAPGYQPHHGCFTDDRTIGVGWQMDHADDMERTRIAAGRPAKLLVLLGNNDAATGWPGQDGWSATDRSKWSALLGATHQATCVVIMLPGTGAGTNLPAAYRAELAEARQAMRDLGAARPGPEVYVDWQAIVDAETAAGRPPLAADGVHIRDDPSGRMVAGTRAVDPVAAAARMDAMWEAAAACPA